MERNERLTAVINDHGVHIDHRDFEIANARADAKKFKQLHEAAAHDNASLRTGEIIAENKTRERQNRAEERYDLLQEELRVCKTRAATVERNLREENHRADTTSRANYEAQLLNLNVSHLAENVTGNAEIARLAEQIASHAIN
eukprot:396175-Heterocapsa_arctica.AAC.1